MALDNSGLGRLPTLGLNQIKLEELDKNEVNLFRVQPTTEKLFVARELEREFKDLGRFEKNNLHVHEKKITTRSDRAGTIRVVNAIPALKKANEDRRRTNRTTTTSQDDFLSPQPKGNKVNIFSAPDTNIIEKPDHHETQALVAVDEASSASHTSLSQFGSTMTQKAAKRDNYLDKGRQRSESVREFVESSRKILMAQISINTKTQETMLLKEYIVMEKEKLEEGKKTFVEDKEKYEKFKLSLTA